MNEKEKALIRLAEKLFSELELLDQEDMEFVLGVLNQVRYRRTTLFYRKENRQR